jgi:hypothetical protein
MPPRSRRPSSGRSPISSNSVGIISYALEGLISSNSVGFISVFEW